MFGALLAPSVLSLLTTTFTDPRERGRAFGIYASIAIAGAAFGLILGGFLTQYLDWRWCLYVNLPIAGLVALGALDHDPDPDRAAGIRLDIPGVVLGCGGLVSLVYGLGEAGAERVGSPRVSWPCSSAQSCSSAAFVLWQSKGPEPAAAAARAHATATGPDRSSPSCSRSIGMFGTFLFLTYLLQTVDQYSPLKTGIAFLPLMVRQRPGRDPVGQPAHAPRPDPAAGGPRAARSLPSAWRCSPA